jgi:hypothetical protein
MSFDEKNTWVYTALAIVLPAIYAATVFGQLGSTPLDRIAYVTPLFFAIGAAIALSIFGHIVVSLIWPKEAERRDERDKQFSRRGELVGYYVLSAGVVGVLALTVMGADHFWIANAIYGAFVTAAIVSSVVKLVAYRLGA